MKKPALLVLGMLLLAFISIYFLIPQRIYVKSTSRIYASDINTAKFILNKSLWKKWWPEKHTGNDSSRFSHNGLFYLLENSTNGGIEVRVKNNDINLESHITYFATEEGLTTVTWYAEKQSSLNPFKRIAEYLRLKHIVKDMDNILSHLKQYMENDRNVYGIKVSLEKVTDPVMLATQTTTTTYPDTKIIYMLIDGLKKSIISKGAQPTNNPMLNISMSGKNNYQIMVAIPVNKEITPDKNSFINRMVKGGNILTAQVKGGRNTIDNAFLQLRNYQKDHHLTSPAMPYELVITDRLTEKDSSRWITKIYYPVF